MLSKGRCILLCSLKLQFLPKLLPRPSLSFSLVSSSLSIWGMSVANVQWRFAADLWYLPTAAPRKRQTGVCESREQISQRNIPNRAYSQGHVGTSLIDGLAALQCFKLLKKKITMHAWTERRGGSTSDNRAVYKGVVKKGMELLDSTLGERSDNEITWGDRLLCLLTEYGVSSFKSKHRYATITYFLSITQYKHGSQREGIWGNFLESCIRDCI